MEFKRYSCINNGITLYRQGCCTEPVRSPHGERYAMRPGHVRTSQAPRPVSVVSYGHRTISVRTSYVDRATPLRAPASFYRPRGVPYPHGHRAMHVRAFTGPLRYPYGALASFPRLQTCLRARQGLGSSLEPSHRVLYELKKTRTIRRSHRCPYGF